MLVGRIAIRVAGPVDIDFRLSRQHVDIFAECDLRVSHNARKSARAFLVTSAWSLSSDLSRTARVKSEYRACCRACTSEKAREISVNVAGRRGHGFLGLAADLVLIGIEVLKIADRKAAQHGNHRQPFDDVEPVIELPEPPQRGGFRCSVVRLGRGLCVSSLGIGELPTLDFNLEPVSTQSGIAGLRTVRRPAVPRSCKWPAWPAYLNFSRAVSAREGSIPSASG